MKNTTTATTCTALTIITPAARCTRDPRAAYAPAVIILPDHMPTQTDADRARRLYAVAHAATAVCLRARSQSEGGEGYISDMRRQWYNDAQLWEHIPDMADRAALHRLTHDQQRDRAEAAQAEADRLTREAWKLTTSERDRAAMLAAATTHAQTAARARDKAADELATAQAIDKLIEQTTAADRESIVHEAIAGYLTANYSTTESDAFRAACSAAGKAIDAQRSAQGYTATRTTLIRMGGKDSTEAENTAAYQAWTEQHPNAQRIPFNIRGGMSAGYWTAEHRDASKPRKDGSSRRRAGYYLVKHYRTTTTAPLDEAMDLTKPQRAHLLDVQRIMNAASLTARDRAALLLLTVATGAARPTSSDPAKVERVRKAAAIVRRAGRQAVEQYDAETAAAVAACDTQRKRQRKQRDRDRQRERVRSAAMLDAAMRLAGYNASDEARQKARERLRARLTAAIKHSQQPQQQPAAATAPAVTVTRYDATGREVYRLTPDTSAATSRHPYPGHVATVGTWEMDWSTKYDPSTARTITEADRAAELAAYQRSRAARTPNALLLAERQRMTADRLTRTAYAAHDAQAAALVLWDSLTRAQQLDALADAASTAAARAGDEYRAAVLAANARHNAPALLARADRMRKAAEREQHQHPGSSRAAWAAAAATVAATDHAAAVRAVQRDTAAALLAWDTARDHVRTLREAMRSE